MVKGTPLVYSSVISRSQNSWLRVSFEGFFNLVFKYLLLNYNEHTYISFIYKLFLIIFIYKIFIDWWWSIMVYNPPKQNDDGL